MKEDSIPDLYARIQGKPRIYAFIEIVRFSFRREFSARHDAWTRANRELGHDLSAALFAQEKFGGEVFRGEISQGVAYHWNVISGRELHLTRAGEHPDIGDLRGKAVARKELLESDDGLTEVRYQLFRDNVDRVERALAAHAQRPPTRNDSSST